MSQAARADAPRRVANDLLAATVNAETEYLGVYRIEPAVGRPGFTLLDRESRPIMQFLFDSRLEAALAHGSLLAAVYNVRSIVTMDDGTE
jgi:hypothetical protein